MGWVVTVRGHGNIVFATIRDKLGNIQVITKSGECDDDIREKLSHLKEHSSIAVVGKTRKNEKSPTGIEVVPSAALALVFVFGLFVVGFDQGHIFSLVMGEQAFDEMFIHELTHDMRHAAGFPCH